MKYVIEYEHLEDEMVTGGRSKWYFDQVKESANKYSLELSDEEFEGFFKLQKAEEDIGWLMHKMSMYRVSFTDALVSYITFAQ